MAKVELIYSRAFWRHIDMCPTCIDERLCSIGSELLEAKNEEIAMAIAPVPALRSACENDA